MENNASFEEILRLGAETPKLNHSPLPKYCMADQSYGMTIGVAVTKKGRIFVCWVGGGDSSDAYFLLAYSDDHGMTFSEPCLVIDPHRDNLPFKRCTIVGTLFVDPDNRMFLFFNQSVEHFDGRSSNWMIRCDDPDAETPVFTEPQYVSFGCTLNKPIILTSGEWLLPVSLWPRRYIAKALPEEVRENIYHDLDEMRMAHIFSSNDKGATWARKGGVVIPHTQFDEHMFVERRDGSLFMLARTQTGLASCCSYDGGMTFTEPKSASMQSVPARVHLRKLKSGRILLIKHGEALETAAPDRSILTAFLSDDDGETFCKGFVLDERFEVSYPDSDEDADGTIYITYDRNRATDGEILMARLKEDDILAGKLVNDASFLKRVVRKPGKLLNTQ